ncbi:hypothetical protein OG883_10820 [Streptomyces sp. NBC_01142]|nr:hypothetical protein [Streptomyces sp. NBC_01142]MCX4820393.1 hypothetical protein [Streptomyces sp. NBC_01142]
MGTRATAATAEFASPTRKPSLRARPTATRVPPPRRTRQMAQQ